MYIDFEYDGLKLSDMGYMLCKFDSGGLETVSNGAQITFNTVPIQNGAKYVLANTQYDTCLEATFQICKNACGSENDMELTVKEVRELSSWLSRNKYLKFKLLDDEYMNLYFESSFNVSLIKFGGSIIGLELHMTTNRPFALMEPRTIMLSTTEMDETKVIYDISDKEGYIYPYMEITMKKASGDGENGSRPFTITNNAEKISANGAGRITQIKNCEKGEVITLDYPTISSTHRQHENILENGLPNDFNWVFFRISNTYRNPENEIVISHPCDIKIVYSPIAMIGI